MAFTRDSDAPVLERDSDHSARNRARRRVFLLTFTVVLAIGLGYTALQPRIYESTATVLMSAPTAIDETMTVADVQGVAIQRRILTGREITETLVERLADEHNRSMDSLSLRALLDVAAVPDTNLLELQARGEDRDLLPALVESWIDVYSGIRARDMEERRSQTLTEVDEELTGLEERLVTARQALADYREEHEIISMERQENAVLSQLDGLNKALNNAVEEEVKAKAYLDALSQSLASGEQVVPSTERAAVAAMAKELESLRSRLRDLRTRYTDDYIRKDPRLREIPQQIEELEADLARAYAQGTTAELDSARRAWETARSSVTELESRLRDHKASVANFNTIYAKHQALAEDLARLEELNRETQARQVQIEVRQTERYPQLAVIDWPLPQAARIGPAYGLLLGASALAAMLLGIFATWLYSYLHPRQDPPAYINLSGVHMYPQDGMQALEQGAAAARLAATDSARLAHQDPEDDDETQEAPPEADR